MKMLGMYLIQRKIPKDLLFMGVCVSVGLHIRVLFWHFSCIFHFARCDGEKMLLPFYGDAVGNGAERDILCVMLFSMVGGKPETYI